jgi:hypothetical protein
MKKETRGRKKLPKLDKKVRLVMGIPGKLIKKHGGEKSAKAKVLKFLEEGD